MLRVRLRAKAVKKLSEAIDADHQNKEEITLCRLMNVKHLRKQCLKIVIEMVLTPFILYRKIDLSRAKKILKLALEKQDNKNFYVEISAPQAFISYGLRHIPTNKSKRYMSDKKKYWPQIRFAALGSSLLSLLEIRHYMVQNNYSL
ncbi:hypothetical protein NQ317_011003 [Molorchus minor]|uniref:Ribosomal protein L22 n=1 Tax=Molorchus minor TaxID=1323400 RepID=A0ABQ9K4Q0_9CUCU|nr:hypothetical protein NQ317_011003 [Molorchus minor]